MKMVGYIFLLMFMVITSCFSYGNIPNCICPYNYDPVCGIDGKTYANLCLLRCSRVPLAYKGECRGCFPGPIHCLVNPCLYSRCPRFPYAKCISCNCQARFYLFGTDVTRLCYGYRKGFPLRLEID